MRTCWAELLEKVRQWRRSLLGFRRIARLDSDPGSGATDGYLQGDLHIAHNVGTKDEIWSLEHF